MPKTQSKTRRQNRRNAHNRKTLRRATRAKMRDALNRGLEYGRGGTYWHPTKSEILGQVGSQSNRYTSTKKKVV